MKKYKLNKYLKLSLLVVIMLGNSFTFWAQKKEQVSLDSLLKYGYSNTEKSFTKAYAKKEIILAVDASSWTEKELDKINEFTALQVLKIAGYKKEYFPESAKELKKLRVLKLGSWGTFTSFPKTISSISTLEYLDVNECGIDTFPTDLSNFALLKELHLPKKMRYNEKVRIWKALNNCTIDHYSNQSNEPKSLCNINRPWHGYFSSINEALKYPNKVKKIRICTHEDLKNIGKLNACKNLKNLLIYDLSINKIPIELYNLSNLEYLMITKCYVSEIPEGISKLKNLKIFVFSSNDFKSFPKDFCNLKNLQELYLEECKFEKVPENIGNLKNLQILAFGIANGDNLGTSITPINELPKSLFKLKNLERLQISYTNINKIPADLKKLTNLKVLTINQQLLDDEEFVANLKKTLPNCRIE